MPTPTAPPYGQVVVLAGGNVFLIERTWSLGELMIGVAVLTLAGLLLMHFLYALARGKA